MAVPANTYKTYEMVGIREDLSNVITTITPSEAKFYDKCGAADSIGNTKHEWQTDSLAAAADNAHLEGDDTTIEASSPTVKLYNNMQIQKKSVAVSGTAKAKKIDIAGRPSELDYQTAKRMKELVNDIEYAYLKGVRQDGAAATIRKMRGALNWVTTNLNKAGDATLNADGTVTGGTARALTQAMLDGVLQDIWTAGGNTDTIWSPAIQKRNISAFATGSTDNYRVAVEGNKLDGTIDIYVSEFGTHAIVPHRQMPVDVLFLSESEHWKKSELRGTHREMLAKTGDSEKYHILVEHTLESRAENAQGRITDLT